MTHDLAAIRKLLDEAVDDNAFLDLCLYEFPEVHKQFTTGQQKGQRVRLLLDYADRHRQLDKLLAAVKEANAVVYSEYEQRLAGAAAPTTPPPAPAEQETCDILVLAANPLGTPQLDLQAEADLIRQRLQEGEAGRRYRVRAEWAVRADQLSRHLLSFDPVIIHFSGHGSRSGELLLQDEHGRPQP